MNPSLMQLSPTARYALCGMACIANRPTGNYALVEEIATTEKMPRHFLAKIFQQLAQHGFLISRRGPGGGYALAQPPKNISLISILSALGHAPISNRCFLEDRNCDAEEPCAMHEAAVAAAELMLTALQGKTLADLAQVPVAPQKDSRHV